jgi:hypothetical protein
MAQSLERLARNQALFREVNERINQVRPDTLGFAEFVCECSDAVCSESVAIRSDEYEAVRSDPNRFLVAPGHATEAVEDVVEDHGRFLVIEKTVERRFMDETDPRARETRD